MMLPDSWYDILKWVVMIAIPALTTAYVGFSGIWGWPYADEVSRTIAAVYTFLCALMGISQLTAKEE